MLHRLHHLSGIPLLLRQITPRQRHVENILLIFLKDKNADVSCFLAHIQFINNRFSKSRNYETLIFFK